ncbi:MAG TPA: pyridoxal-dependent decarboxylase [Solirubrobacteraceae bacterium]|nr:pyridoxal-dependent decarboxylase [Solirubrobacteraceae bacterium]
MDPRYDVLDDAAHLARDFINGLPERPVGATASAGELRARLARPLTDAGEDPRTVIADLAADVDDGLIASPGPRYFGFVVGGALPVAVAADWLVSSWDQNAGGFPVAPAMSVAEGVAGGWVRELLGLPVGAGVGIVTGCQMAHFTCLAAARHAVLREAGWNVEANGLQGAPPLRVVAGAHAHVTVAAACRMLGLGSGRIRIVPADAKGRMLASELDIALTEHDGPQIVCAQAGEVNSGAVDPLGEIADICDVAGAWCHVDGAFGLWAAASPRRRVLLEGVERADSWATDGHKWLNVPYDCGIAIVADAEAQHAAMSSTAEYLPAHDGDEHWPGEWAPEFSRRARGIPLYAALRALGRDGVADLVDRCCDLAQRIAARLDADDRVEILNDVVLNQVLVRFGGDDDVTNAVIDRFQREGTTWASASRWHGKAVLRISVSGWQTTAADADRSADAILAALRATTA